MTASLAQGPTWGLWSNASSWATGRVPAEGEIVTIATGFTVILDVEETAVLNQLHVRISSQKIV